MKKLIILSCAVFALALTAGTSVAADSISDRLGVSGRIGFLVPEDSDAFFVPSRLETDVGFIGGGGLIYGINKNFAAEFDITHSEFDADLAGFRAGDFSTTYISFGAQYRFVDLGTQRLVPYLGAGLDILVNDFTFDDGDNASVDTVAGAHLSGGVDYFLTNQLALTAEVKGLLAPDADISVEGVKVGNYNPTSLSTTFGIRFFFN
ncbi:MAG: porin family protein [Deltaproteobacteria bacterium]|nr:porin family protein [Deltaproteobacteria bacterium]TLN01989.1 MAG: porin family protein [bacterium]